MKAGWDTGTLVSVSTSFTDGDWIETKDQSESGIRLVQTGNVGIGDFKDRRDKARFISEATFERLKCFEVLPDDCLISRLPDPVGRGCLIPDTGDKMITAVDCSVVRIDQKKMLPSFYLYYLQSAEYFALVEADCTGTTRKRISRKKLEAIPIPIPPLEEQKRIVAVLDAAFEGLTRAKENAETNLQNARELFEAGLVSVFSAIENESDQKLLKEIALDFGRGKSKHRPRNAPFLYDGPYPFVQTGDVRNSEHLITEYKQTYTDAGLAQSKLWPADTLCITIAANIAETAILSFDACFPDSIIGVVPDPKLTSSRYLEYLLQYFQKRLKARGEGAAQHNINLATFETEYFPFPSLSKQDAAIDALDKASSAVQLAEAHYRTKLTDIADLRQSLLQKAFAGELT